MIITRTVFDPTIDNTFIVFDIPNSLFTSYAGIVEAVRPPIAPYEFNYQNQPVVYSLDSNSRLTMDIYPGVYFSLTRDKRHLISDTRYRNIK